MLHVVLFTPRADLTQAQRGEIEHALTAALTDIQAIVRYRLGRRAMLGAAYEAAMREDYEYCMIAEFADRDGLATYLSHPAHAAIGRLFYETSARALAYDYDAVDGDPAAALASWR